MLGYVIPHNIPFQHLRESLQKWERSQERKKWLEKSKDVIEGERKVEMQSNLELWFTPRGTNGSRPAAPPHTHTTR